MGGGWMVKATPRPLSPGERDLVPNVQEAGWDPGPFWTRAENLAPTGIRFPDRQARSELVYRLSYSGCLWIINYCVLNEVWDISFRIHVFSRFLSWWIQLSEFFCAVSDSLQSSQKASSFVAARSSHWGRPAALCPRVLGWRRHTSLRLYETFCGQGFW
jgi:hypothetical protein